MPLTFPVLDDCAWPWAPWTLHALYLASGLLIAVHYVPQIRLAWRHPSATVTAQSLSTWSVWTLCRSVAFAYGVFVLHDLVFLVVVGADMIGRLAMVALILRAHALAGGLLGGRARSQPARRSGSNVHELNRRSAAHTGHRSGGPAGIAARARLSLPTMHMLAGSAVDGFTSLRRTIGPFVFGHPRGPAAGRMRQPLSVALAKGEALSSPPLD